MDFIFSIYAKYKGSDFEVRLLQFEESMSTDDLIQEQKVNSWETSRTSALRATIPEGYTLEQIVTGQLKVIFKEPLTADAFLAKSSRWNLHLPTSSQVSNLLGSLQQRQWRSLSPWREVTACSNLHYQGSTTVESLIDDMLAAMDKRITVFYLRSKKKSDSY